MQDRRPAFSRFDYILCTVWEAVLVLLESYSVTDAHGARLFPDSEQRERVLSSGREAHLGQGLSALVRRS